LCFTTEPQQVCPPTYDAENRLQIVTNTATGEETTFAYDGDGQRVTRDTMTDTIAYIGSYYEKQILPQDLDGNGEINVVDIMQVASRWRCRHGDDCYDAVYDLDDDGDIDIVDIMKVAAAWGETCPDPETVKYYTLGGRRVAMRKKPMGQADTLYYLFSDHLGSTSVVYNTNNDTWTTQRYYPYGSTRSGEAPTDRLFTGQRFDATIGLYDYGARFYDPALGRFISADPIVPEPGNPQSLNRYSYVYNNPLRYVDPSGHALWPGDGGDGRRWPYIPPGQYIYTRDYGFFDTSHFGTGDPVAALERAKEAVRLGEPRPVRFYQGVKGGLAHFEGVYKIRGDLVEPEQVEGVVLAMYEDWSIRFEYFEGSIPIFGRGTSFAVEDLPSHHLGFYEATGMPREEIFDHLGGVDYVTDSEPSREGEIENREFHPLVRVGPGRWLEKAWPAALDAISPITDPNLWRPVSFDAWVRVGPSEFPWPLGRTTWGAGVGE
jgi:RHS repeat-associated protein